MGIEMSMGQGQRRKRPERRRNLDKRPQAAPGWHAGRHGASRDLLSPPLGSVPLPPTPPNPCPNRSLISSLSRSLSVITLLRTYVGTHMKARHTFSFSIARTQAASSSITRLEKLLRSEHLRSRPRTACPLAKRSKPPSKARFRREARCRLARGGGFGGGGGGGPRPGGSQGHSPRGRAGGGLARARGGCAQSVRGGAMGEAQRGACTRARADDNG